MYVCVCVSRLCVKHKLTLHTHKYTEEDRVVQHRRWQLREWNEFNTNVARPF